MGLPDLVVPVRQGAVNEPLRYALRTWAANLPHRKVWIVGHRLPWLAGVEHIPTVQRGLSKYTATTLAVRKACEHPDVSSTFLLCNDDFFVMEPIAGGMPVLHRGLMRDVEAYYASRASGSYLRGMRETRDLLASLGVDDPISYELHVPMPVDKVGMLGALDLGRDLTVLHKRTMYGNLARLGGEQISDVKVLHRGPTLPPGPFLSTMPDSFASGFVGQRIRRAFPKPCRYERAGRRR